MEEVQKNISQEKEIDLLALTNKVWLRKKFLFKVLAIGFVVGLIIAFSIPKEYTTTVILTPESKSGGSGAMGSLAALAGVNLNSAMGEDALASPDLYPTILSSTSFLKGLLNIKVHDSDKGVDTTLYAYMNDYQSSAWWSYILKAPSAIKGLFTSKEEDKGTKDSENKRVISKEEMDIIEALSSRLTVSSDKKTGVTTIEVIMQSPEVSSFLADTLTSYLQSYIIEYRTQKAKTDLLYAEKLCNESKENYYKAQANLASFLDRNIGIVLASYRTTQDRLQNEATLAFSVYNQTAQQLQMAKIKVQDTTPVFTVIQPAVQPLFPSKPSKKMVMAGTLFLAFIGAVVWVLRKDIFEMLSSNNECS
ncbi:MAG: chain-length determining protein [Prevotella sp.]|jgi:uncharacterized protein involved in exopolysaccharide biosynthesis|nr:chain-length determining protein [Prevotella sp.]